MSRHRILTIFLSSWALWTLKYAKCEMELAMKQDVANFNNSIALDALSFIELVNKSKVFVDTTLLIKEVLQPGSTDLDPNLHTWLWLGPGKIGKSINLDMIKTFFEIHVDEKGNKIDPKQSRNYKLFTTGELHMPHGTVQKLKSPLAISKNKTIVDQHLGQHPVIHVQFKDTEVPDLALINKTMKLSISRAYKEHEYMVQVLQDQCKKKTTNESCNDLKTFEGYLHRTNEEVECGISFLSRILANHFKSKAVVLLDDYDAPLLTTLMDLELDLDPTYELMALLVFKIFDSSEHLFLAIITSKYKIEAQNFNTEKQLTQKDDPTSQYFGFNRKIVDALFEKLQIKDELRQQAHQWYDGYRSTTNQHFYNPNSIAKFLQQKEIVAYSKQNSYTDYIQIVINNYPDIRVSLLTLLSQQTTEVRLEESGVLRHKLTNLLTFLNEVWRNAWFQHAKTFFQHFFWYLSKEGYLFILPNSNNARLLNNEMGFLLCDRMIYSYKQEYQIRDQLLTKAAHNLRDFITNKSATTTSLQESLDDLYKSTSLKGNKTNEVTIRSVFYSVVLHLQYESKLETDVFFNKTRKGDVVVVDKQVKHAAIVELSFNDVSAEKAFQEAEKHDGIFTAADNVQKIKLLGINITPDKSVQVLGKLKN